ncbi:kinase-like protein [Rhizoclosmatium globosum]|uniref:non-specific serine/threonine protein kinase n=1 Tax=Rhizoclosmatium globosum TaxID=329046 RepID=A0A1Y2CQX3_9FUNG|nr:kinase-like protein [Rhizoclosmatium globosum]|eukprot:ORY49346.1 kinase-like protein [Rhizoclosmatium globosum]
MGCCASEPIDFEKEVDITHFEIGISIGKGAFGKVRIVQHKKSKIQYAVKYMNKEEIIKRGSAEHVLSERRLLEEAQHPFIVNLRYAFQDDEHLLMILDLKLGGDLRFHLTYKGPFTEDRAKFYFAEVSCALNYLHGLKIVHRDIKPDNILLDEKGHASVTDFNVACHYKDDKPLTSKSGTARYMAPEVVAGTGYLNAVDWWSLGITTYEMFYGYAPFRARHKDELRKSIMNDPLEFSKNPKYNISDVAIQFITALLTRPLEDRLGSNENGGYAKIKEHEWFKDIVWDKVEKKELPVPFVPDVEKNAYHDPRYGLEEMFSGRNELADKPVRNGGSIGGRRRSSAVQSTSGNGVPGSQTGTSGPPTIDTNSRAQGVGMSRSPSISPNSNAAAAAAVAAITSPTQSPEKKGFFVPPRRVARNYISRRVAATAV